MFRVNPAYNKFPHHDYAFILLDSEGKFTLKKLYRLTYLDARSKLKDLECLFSPFYKVYLVVVETITEDMYSRAHYKRFGCIPNRFNKDNLEALPYDI